MHSVARRHSALFMSWTLLYETDNQQLACLCLCLCVCITFSDCGDTDCVHCEGFCSELLHIHSQLLTCNNRFQEFHGWHANNNLEGWKLTNDEVCLQVLWATHLRVKKVLLAKAALWYVCQIASRNGSYVGISRDWGLPDWKMKSYTVYKAKWIIHTSWLYC